MSNSIWKNIFTIDYLFKFFIRFTTIFGGNKNIKIIFTDYFVLYPNIEDFGEYQARNEASLATSVGANWGLRLSNIIDYDSDPAIGVSKTDTNWILGLQYGF